MALYSYCPMPCVSPALIFVNSLLIKISSITQLEGSMAHSPVWIWFDQQHLDCFISTVSLQFPGHFVPMSLRPVLRTKMEQLMSWL